MMQSYNNSVWDPQNYHSGQTNNYRESVQAGPSYRQQTTPPVPTQYQPEIPPRSLSAGPSAPPLPPLPPSLTPGGRNRGQSAGGSTAGLFFENRSDYGFPRRASDATQLPEPFHSPRISRPRYSQSYTASTVYSQSQRQPALPSPPPLPRKPMDLSDPVLSRPPIPPKLQAGYPSPPLSSLPPKIPFYPRPLSGPVGNVAESPMSQRPEPTEPEEDKDLALALAVSASEATGRNQELSDVDEDEQLARALEESRMMAEASKSSQSTPSPSPVGVQVIPPDIGPSWVPGMPMPVPSMPGVPRVVRSLPHSPAPASSGELEIDPMDNQPWLTSSPQNVAIQLSDDEALARRLAAEDAEQSGSNQPPSSQESDTSEPPLYTPAIANVVNAPAPQPSYAPSVASGDSHTDAANDTSISRQNSVMSASSLGSGRPASDSQLASQVLAVPSSSSSPVARPATADTSSLSVPSPTPNSTGKMRPMSSMSALNTSVGDSSSGISANPFVEKELLHGVSVGFTAPTVSSTLAPMTGPMPNIITLPFGKSPPLHLQAPSWRHLLKLMARLSGTRIEPTLEAVAVSKEDLKLRTVVQFIRVHHSSSDWRVVLYFTIDHPVAANAPNAWKYTNGDVSTLPWSYTLSTIPTLLRDGADSELSSYYSIPSTPNTPYPTLPINFPNLAMYLQAALEDSRRAMHDSSSGIRKLAKCVDSYYTNDRDVTSVIEDDAADGGNSRRSNFFKKVIARVPGNKQKGRGRNEEVYEFVTPFVPDEWG